jgi:hypothetical protein
MERFNEVNPRSRNVSSVAVIVADRARAFLFQPPSCP